MVAESLTDAHRAATRRRLEDAARTVFSVKGYSRATIADVITEAGVSRGTLYLHFDTKQELLAAAARDIVAESVQAMSELGAVLARGKRKDLVHWLTQTIAWYEKNRDMALAMGEVELSEPMDATRRGYEQLLDACSEWTDLWPRDRRPEALLRLDLCRSQLQHYMWGFEPMMEELDAELAPVLADMWWTALQVPAGAEPARHAEGPVSQKLRSDADTAQRTGAPESRTLRQEQRSLTQARIVTAARAVFERNGYAGSSLNDVAAEAGVGRATLYLHFDSKSALMRAAMETLAEQNTLFVHSLRDVLLEGTRAGLRAWLTEALDWFFTLRPFARAIQEYMLAEPADSAVSIRESVLIEISEWVNKWPAGKRSEARLRFELCRLALQHYAWSYTGADLPTEDAIEILTDFWDRSLQRRPQKRTAS